MKTLRKAETRERVLYIYKWLKKHEEGLSMEDIMDKLGDMGLSSTRKSIYQDLYTIATIEPLVMVKTKRTIYKITKL